MPRRRAASAWGIRRRCRIWLIANARRTLALRSSASGNPRSAKTFPQLRATIWSSSFLGTALQVIPSGLLQAPRGTASPGCNRLKPASTKASSSPLREMQDSNQSSTASRNDSTARCSVSAWVITSRGGHQASHTAPLWRVHACSFTRNSTTEQCTNGFLQCAALAINPWPFSY